MEQKQTEPLSKEEVENMRNVLIIFGVHAESYYKKLSAGEIEKLYNRLADPERGGK